MNSRDSKGRYKLELVRKLTEVKHDLRTNPTFGTLRHFPAFGESFFFYEDPIYEGTVRVVATSTVKYIVGGPERLMFITRNSLYRLSRLDE